jgi:hypothetical protein
MENDSLSGAITIRVRALQLTREHGLDKRAVQINKSQFVEVPGFPEMILDLIAKFGPTYTFPNIFLNPGNLRRLLR